MLDKLIRKSTDYLINNQVISEEDRDVYEYGFHSLYNNIIDVSSLIVISVWFNLVPQTVLYHVAFVSLRTVAGGFHAKTHLRCFIMSTLIWLLSMWVITQSTSPAICIGLSGVAALLLWLVAPIEHINNPLSEEKYKRMKLLSRIISATFFVVVIILSTLADRKNIWITASLAYGMASHSILILAALLQKYCEKVKT